MIKIFASIGDRWTKYLAKTSEGRWFEKLALSKHLVFKAYTWDTIFIRIEKLLLYYAESTPQQFVFMLANLALLAFV